MAKLPRRPFWCGGDGAVESEDVLEHDECAIDKVGDAVRMFPIGAWTDRKTALAKEYKVSLLHLDTSSFGDRAGVEFLLDLPRLSELSISLYAVKDLSALGQIPGLESLRIDLLVWRLGDQFTPVDFSALSKLERVDVMMCQAFASILECRAIRELAIRNDYDGRVRDLDLSRLPGLRDLKLDHCSKLRRVMLHPKARIRAMELSNCGSYQIEWERVGPELRFLTLGGRLKFPLEDILKAPKLEELQTLEIRKLPPLAFLRQMPCLKHVFLFSAPPGPTVSEEDTALVREINARGNGR